MTQAIANTLNNIDEMMSMKAAVSQNTEATDASGMDKTVDFEKIFEAKVDEQPMTIGDVKAKFSFKEIVSEGLTNFKEILAQATDEANVETSLDLTLARDINEIITQLKDAVKAAEKNIETTNEEDEILPVISEEIIDFEEDKVVDSEDEESLEVDSSLSVQEDKQILFEQILAYVDSQAGNKSDNYESVNKVIDKPVAVRDAENLLNFDAEVLETISESITDEMAKTSEENTIEEFEITLDEDALGELKIESMEAELYYSDDDGFVNQQSPEEYGLKAIINQEVEVFDLKIDKSLSLQSSQPTVSPKAVDVNPSRIIEQISKQLEGLQNNAKVNIVLNPESLGKVNVQLLTTKEGLSAQFTVATQEAREILMKGLEGLKDTLISHGVSVDNVSVKLSDVEKGSYNPDWTEQEGSRGGNKQQEQQNREEKEKGLFAKMMEKTIDKENGNV